MTTPNTSANSAQHTFNVAKRLSVYDENGKYVPAQKAWRNLNKAKTTAIVVTSSPNKATFTVTGHSFVVGDLITVVGASPSTINTTYTVATVTSSTSFTATPTGTAFAATATTQGEIIFTTPTSRWVQVYPTTVYVDTFTYTLSTPSYNTVTFTFNVPNATSWTIFNTDTNTTIASGNSPVGTQTVTYTSPTAQTPIDFKLNAFGPIYNATTNTISTGSVTQPITVNFDQLPAPTFAPTVSSTGITDVSAVVTWTGTYSGATSFDIVDFNTGVAFTGGSSVASGATITGLTKGSTYTIALQAKVGPDNSPTGLATTFTTDNYVNGDYYVNPKQAYTWVDGGLYATPAWLGTSNNYYHGNGYSYSDLAGTYYTFFYYGSNAFANVPSATWSNIAIYFKRSSVSPGPTTTYVTMTLHKYTTYSSANTVNSTTDYATSKPADKSGWYRFTTVPLTKGKSGWITIPSEWVALLKAGTYKGITIGGQMYDYSNSSTGYMRLDRDLTSGLTNINGQMKVTVT